MSQSLNSQEVLNDVVRVVGEVSGLEPSDLAIDSSLLDLGLDSLMFVRIGRIIEKKYQVQIAMEAFYENLHVIGPLRDFLVQHGHAVDVRVQPISTGVTGTGMDSSQHGGAVRENVQRPITTPTPAFVPTAPLMQPAQVPRTAGALSTPIISLPNSSALDGVMAAHLRLMQKYLAAARGSDASLAPNQTPYTVTEPEITRQERSLPVNETAVRPMEHAAVKTPAAPQEGATMRGRFAGVELEPRPLTSQQKTFIDDLTRRMETKVGLSKEHTGKHRPHLSDWKHSLQFKRSLKELKYSVVAERSEGAYIWDLDGNQYIDVTMGMGVFLFGHSPEFVQTAIRGQLDKSSALGPQSPLAGEAAEKICQMTGHDRASLSITGSGAVMLAVRVARAARGRNGIVKFSGAYHGINSEVMSAEGDSGPIPISLGVPQGCIEDVHTLDYGAGDSLDWIREHANELAAVLLEPVQSRRPGFQPQRFIRRLRRLTRETGVLLICDEMISGFRVHPAGAQGWFGIQGDLATYGKIVGGGMPMSVIAGRKDLLDYIDGGDWNYGDDTVPTSETIFTGGTHNRHPLCLAAGIAALNHLKEQGGALQETLNHRTDRLVARLNYFFEREDVPVRVANFGSQFRFECAQFPFEMEVFFFLLQLKGIYTWEQHICCLSTAHSDADIEAIVAAVRESVVDLRQGGFDFRVNGLPRRHLPMSSVQRRLYALHQREGAERPYHLSGAWTIRGTVDVERLQHALHTVICRHESLRTGFHVLEGELIQQIVDEPRFNLQVMDASGRPPLDILEDFVAPFDLAAPPLLRAAIAHVDATTSYLLVDVHHLAADGLSMNVILKELVALYDGADLSPVKRQCRHVQDELRRLQESGGLNEQKAYWLNKLSGELPVLDLPLDRPRPARFDFRGEHVTLRVEPEQTAKLRAIARGQQVSLFMMILGAFAGLLNRLTGQTDLLVGLPVPGRPGDENDEAVGMFVNTVVLRFGIKDDETLASLLKQTRHVCLEALDRPDYSFGDLLSDLGIKGRPDRNPLFDVMFSYERADERKLSARGLEFETVAQYQGAGMFDFNIDVIEESDVLYLNCAYALSLLDRETAVRWMEYYKRILDAMTADVSRPLAGTSVMSESELKQVTETFSRPGGRREGAESSLVDEWNRQVASTPDNTALRFEDRSWSYRVLDVRANTFARWLQEDMGVGRGDRVVTCLDSTDELIVALLGILKSGGVYVPQAVDLPAARLEVVARATHCKMIVSHRMDLSESGVRVSVPPPESPNAGHASFAVTVQPADLAYIIFTSGSTGTPKGVQIEHRTIVRSVQWRIRAYEFTPHDVILQMPSCAFDASILDILSSLFCGATLVMLPVAKKRELTTMARVFSERGVTHALLTPGLYRLYLSEIHDSLASLRVVTLAGEALPESLAREHYRRLPGVVLWNEYGPTENSVVSTACMVPRDVGRITIGFPVDHTNIHILDEKGVLSPIGVWGEMWLSGGGLARGYEGQPDLTREVFRDLPCQPGTRAYRTGDIARWRTDGEIEFRGRRDSQIKLNGYRIELEEIESALRRAPGVEDAVVDVIRSSDESATLAAWIVARQPVGIQLDDVRRSVARMLPAWMVPSLISTIPVIPLNRNGKVSRADLPSPTVTQSVPVTAPTADGTTQEMALLAACRSVLRKEALSLDDHYFALGGDSIQGILLVAKLHESGWQLSLDDLFNHPILRELAGVMKRSGQAVVTWTESDVPTLPPMQSWYLGFASALSEPFNFSMWLDCDLALDVTSLKGLLLHWLEQHPSARSVILPTNKAERQRTPASQTVLTTLSAEKALSIDSCDVSGLSELELASLAESRQRMVHLAGGPVMDAVLCRSSRGARVLLTVHHVGVDGVSLQILIREMNLLRRSQLAQQDFPELKEAVSLRQWTSQWQEPEVRAAVLTELPYWLGTRTDDVSLTATTGATGDQGRRHVRATVPRSTALQALTESHRAFGTQGADLLLTAYVLALRDVLGRETVRLELESHGRASSYKPADLSTTVGWFTAAYPIVFRVGRENVLSDVIQHVKDTLRAVPSQGVGYGVLRYVMGETSAVAMPAPEISFNYLGSFESDDKDAIFRMRSDRIPGQVGQHPGMMPAIECHGFLDSDGLHLTIEFDSARLDDARANTLLQAIVSNVKQLVDVCRNQLQPVVSVGDLQYRNLTPASFLSLLTKHKAAPTDIEDVWPLTPMQSGLYLESRRSPDSEAYFEQMTFRLSGGVDTAVLAASLKALPVRHAALRVSFTVTETGEPVQCVWRHVELPVEVSDLSSRTDVEQRVQIALFEKEDRNRGFQLDSAPLIRMHLFDLGNGVCHVVWSHHHLLMDGWCVGILIEDLMKEYESRRGGVGGSSSAVTSLRPYLGWLDRQNKEAGRSYWQRVLDGYNGPSRLPGHARTVSETGDRYSEHVFKLSADELAKINAWTAQHRVTLSTFIRVIWGTVLARHTNRTDVVFGTIVAGRPPEVPGIQETVGLFINAVPVRFQIDAGMTASEAARALQNQANEGRPFEYVTLGEIQDLASQRELFDHLVVLENYPMDAEVRRGAADSRGLRPRLSDVGGFERTHYPLTVVAVPGDELVLTLTYDSRIYAADDMTRLESHIGQLIRSALNAADEPLSRLAMITDEERRWVTESWNHTAAGYPESATITSLFDAVARKYPSRMALTVGSDSLSYAELAGRIDALAAGMMADPRSKHGARVCLWLPRDESMIIAMLAVLKAGMAYVPLDPVYPPDRLKSILEDCGAVYMLTSSAMSPLWSKVPMLLCEDLIEMPTEALSSPASPVPDQCAYVIYTSGSTGKPKGCMVSHRNVVRLLINDHHDFDFNENDVWVVAHSFCFDFSVWEMYGALLYGGRVVIAPTEIVRNTPEFLSLLQQERVTVLNQTPAAFYNLADEVLRRKATAISQHLRMVIFGGDRLEPAYLAEWVGSIPLTKVALINMYGITETTVHVSYYKLTNDDIADRRGRSMIGRPIPEMEIWVLDTFGSLQPTGVQGELYVGGSGVSLGYLNRDELTRERFLPHPFKVGARVYRSGDLGILWPDGRMEYLGRNDHQVQVRGFRVETGEVESRLLELRGIEKAAVIPLDQDGSVALAAYVVGPQPLGRDTILAHLRARLPEYMVPAHIIWLAQLPLTRNGKLDRKALPMPAATTDQIGHDSAVAPRTALESALCEIWSEVLQTPIRDVRANFFENGGQSLRAVKLVALLQDRYGQVLPLAEVFNQPTLEAQAAFLTPKAAVEEDQELLSLVAGLSAAEMEAALKALES